MRAVVQRVSSAAVTVDGAVVGSIEHGLLVLVGVTHDDGTDDVDALASKLSGLRIFRDEDGRMNRSVADVGGSVLVVSQFTLYGDVRRGRRPSFGPAADPDEAEPLIERFVARIGDAGIPVAEGRFGAMMSVSLVNDGPVTLIVETRDGRIV
jgi:D-tyrosyl-tRNA(Tyr) deacylase